MSKLGRNDRCFCGSGRKYKHCCLLKPQGEVSTNPQASLKLSLMNEVIAVQKAASQGKKTIKELGVFILYSTEKGNAWMLEITDSDCVQLAEDGKILPIPIDENPETIEINWSHIFVIKDKTINLTSYKDRSVTELIDNPTLEIRSAIKRLKKRISPEVVEKIHLDPDQHVKSE